MKRKLLLFLVLSGFTSISQGSLPELFCQLQNYTYAFTPRIIWAAQHCSSIDVLTELKHGGDPNQRNWCDETALHWAAFYSQSVIAKHLLEYNAAPNQCDLSGKTPLHWAFLPESAKPIAHNKLVLKLLRSKADPNAQDSKGNTPLHYGVIWPVTLGALSKENAYRAPESSAISLLLSYGADPNIQDENGNTPLHIILDKADTINLATPIAKLLLRRGANPIISNNDGETPWDIASKRGSEGLVRRLFTIK